MSLSECLHTFVTQSEGSLKTLLRRELKRLLSEFVF